MLVAFASDKIRQWFHLAQFDHLVFVDWIVYVRIESWIAVNQKLEAA